LPIAHSNTAARECCGPNEVSVNSIWISVCSDRAAHIALCPAYILCLVQNSVTPILVAIQEVLWSVVAVIVLITAGKLVKKLTARQRISPAPIVRYHATSTVIGIGLVLFLVRFITLEPFYLPWNYAVACVLGYLRLPIYTVGIIFAFKEAGLGTTVSCLLYDSGPEPHKDYKAERWAWLLAGLLILITTLLLLEYRCPFYFTQDDNLAVNLPEILLACRSLFAGVFPTWNPFQFLGSPNTTLGYYALTYPPTYFSYWFAKDVLGNANATLDVFAFVHLLAAYVVFYWAALREHCRPSVAMMAASCCMTSGYALIFSRSWFQFSAVLLWMALLVVCVQSLARGNYGWKWILAYGAVVGLAFHSGHIQMWMYSVMMADFAILLLFFTQTIPLRSAWAIVSAHFFGLAIAAPLLVPEFQSCVNIVRNHPISTNISNGLVHFYIPITWSQARWLPGSPVLNRKEMYYSGTIFMLIVTVILISWLASHWTKKTVRDNIWVFCALAAFLAALGNHGLLWNLMMYMPGFNGFRFPFKFVAYIVVFTSLAGAAGLERLMRCTHWIRRGEIALAAVVLVILGYHASVSTAAFYSYNFKPFPHPDINLSSRLVSSSDDSYPKVLAVSAWTKERFQELGYRNTDPGFFDSYLNQWPTEMHVFSVDGYNPLVSQAPTVLRMASRYEKNPSQALYEYGVQYVLQYKGYTNPGGRLRVEKFNGTKVVYETPKILLEELPKPRPMAYATDAPEAALPVRFDGAGATIDTSAVAHDGTVILNMLWRREFRAQAGLKTLPVAADEWGRIAVEVPANTKAVRLTFSPHWGEGFVLALVAAGFGLGFGWWAASTLPSASRPEPARLS